MKGLTELELKEIKELIQKYHAFGNCTSCIDSTNPSFVLNIKYVTTTYDTRLGETHVIEFRGLVENVRFSANFWQINPDVKRPSNFPGTLYIWIMRYLRGQIQALPQQIIEF